MKANHLVLIFVFFAACYSPQLGNPGFYCHPDDHPACPDGQKCVPAPGGYRCTSTNVNFDGGAGGDLASRDGSSPLHDMAQGGNHDLSSQPQPDFSVPGDFAMGNMPLCMCTNACVFGCVGQDCCLEDVFAGTCNPDPNCMAN